MSTVEPDPRLETLGPRVAVARQVRALMAHMVGTVAPDDVLVDIAARLEAVAVELGAHPQDRNDLHPGEASLVAAPGEDPPPMAARMLHSPVQGAANPVAPPMVVRRLPDRVLADVRWGGVYEGAPGCVHGGFVAAALDEILGATQWIGGPGLPAMTGRLTVHYRSPTPIDADLHIDATLDAVDGRKRYVSARLHDGERLCAEAEGLFITLRPGHRIGAAVVGDRGFERDRD